MDTDPYLDFLIAGDARAPDDVTAVVGIEPDEAIAKGTRDPSHGLPWQNIWSIRSASADDSVEAHWRSIAMRIEPRLGELAAAGRACCRWASLHVRVTVVVNASERLPSVIIPADMIATLAALGGIIDVDYFQEARSSGRRTARSDAIIGDGAHNDPTRFPARP